MSSFSNILPGLVVMAIYVFIGAKLLGIFAASFIAFLTIYTIYDPAPLQDARAWGKRIIVTAAFMAVIYGLFNALLKVQTPTGFLF